MKGRKNNKKRLAIFSQNTNTADKPPLMQYSNGQKYIFISYSHTDAETVYNDLNVLNKNNVRYLYDSEFKHGESWRNKAKETIESQDCEGVVFYLSQNFVLSESAAVEISYVDSFCKDSIFVNLSRELPEDLIYMTLGSKRTSELKSLNIYDRRKHENLYLKTFPNDQLYIKGSDLVDDDGRVSELLIAIKKKFGESIFCQDEGIDIPTKKYRILGILNGSLKSDGSFIRIYAKFFYNDSDIKHIDTYNAVEIGDSAYEGCLEAEEAVIRETVSYIGDSAFKGCVSLSDVRFKDGIKRIGIHAFDGCTNLGKVCLPPSLVEIGDYLFSKCYNLSAVDICEGIKRIPNHAFEECICLKVLSIPNGVLEIGEYAFYNCNDLKEIYIPDGVRSIGSNAFQGCSNLLDINIPDSVCELGDETFSGCLNITVINIPNHIAIIGRSAFEKCEKIQKIQIPDDTKYIGQWAFKDCRSLKHLTIPSGIKRIGPEAFKGCISLDKIIFNGTKATWNKVKKAKGWNKDTLCAEIHCLDGVIELYAIYADIA